MACFFRFHGRRAFFDTDILTLLPYLCALGLSVPVTVYLFVRGIGLPDNFLQVYDNSFHLSVVQSMKHASSYSILSIGSYLEAGSKVFSLMQVLVFIPPLGILLPLWLRVLLIFLSWRQLISLTLCLLLSYCL